MIRPIHMCCLVLAAYASGKILTFNEDAKQLRIQCPEAGSVNGALLSVYLKQSAGNDKWTTLANWSYGERVESRSNRVDVINPPKDPFTIDVVMNGVTCYDAVAYKCDIIAENNDRGTFRETNHEIFDYSGEITQPVITRQPLKDCYKAGDRLSLDCEANIAKADNNIVWETKLPGEDFSKVTWNMDNVQTPGEKQENATGCTLQSSFPLEYTLKEEDDGRIFQCRLLLTGQTTQFNVSVLCANNDCTKKPTVSPGEPRVILDGPSVRKSQLLEEQPDTYMDTGISNNTLLILLTVIPLSLAVLIVALAVLLRQWRKKQNPQPLVVMDTPTSSDSGYGYADRRLPDLPYLHKQFHANKYDNTTPKRVSSSSSTDNLTNNLSPNASVYVSMTGIDCLKKESETADGTAGAGEGAEPQAEGAGLVDDGLEPDMRSDRSESMYSNKEVIEREAAKARAESMAVGASAFSTGGKIAA